MGLLIGRRREQSDLDEWCLSHKAELVCVYGRRRIGKTYLVDNTFRGQIAFSVTGSEDKRNATQFRVFTRALKRYGSRAERTPHDWFDAFDDLRDLLEARDAAPTYRGRRVVFLDEFPWLAGGRSDFLVAFADFWNSWASKEDDIMVIVCGSATSWIIKNLFENTGSMYNRVTRRLYIAPFNLHESEQLLQAMGLGWDRATTLEAYLAFGGVPYYLDMLDRRLSLAQNIDMLCLSDHAALRDERTHLMEATLSKSAIYGKVLSALAGTRKGLARTKIAEAVRDNGGNLKRALDDLERCGYIRKYENPYELYHPSMYQLTDPFLMFSHRFMGTSRLDSWVDFEDTPAFYAWRGTAFETACITHLAQIKQALGIASVKTKCFPWSSTTSNPGAQVDLVVERADGVTELCEMKCTDEAFVITKDVSRSLQHKRSVFREESKTRNAVHMALVSAAGLAPSSHAGDVIATVTADDLFAF